MSEKYDITLGEGLKGAKPRKEKPTRTTNSGSWYYFGLVGQIGYTIAIPLVVGALIGKLLGATLIGLGVGVAISVVAFIKVIRDALSVK